MSTSRPADRRIIGLVRVIMLALIGLGALTTAQAQKRVFTNEDIGPQPVAPAAQESQPAEAKPGAPAADAAPAALPASANAATQIEPGSPAHAKAAMDGLGVAMDYLAEKLSSNPASTVEERWRTMRDQLVEIIGEIRAVQQADERAAAPQGSAAGDTPAKPAAQ